MKKIIAATLVLSIVIGITVFSYAEEFYGDVNNDGVVNSSDALEILQYSVGLIKKIDEKIADVNHDSNINSSDALLVLQISVGQIPRETVSSTTEYVYDIQKIINNAPLNPMRTNDADLDNIIDEIFAKKITDDMTTYEKTRVLFDYLVQNNEYGYLVAVGTNTRYISAVYDRDVVTRAKTIFKYKRGTCIDFAAAFMCLTRRIGLNCYMVQGEITDLTGKTYYHGWNTIRVDGIDYTFDSQADFRVRQRDENGNTKFVNFGTYYPEIYLEEYVDLAVNTFQNFKTV